MPLQRYHTGDIIGRMPAGFRILGRERDLVFRSDGAVVSAEDIDVAMPRRLRLALVMAQTGKPAGTSTMSPMRRRTIGL